MPDWIDGHPKGNPRYKGPPGPCEGPPPRPQMPSLPVQDSPPGPPGRAVPHVMNLGHDPAYYGMRRVYLDQRGWLDIDPSSMWGFDVTVITASHHNRNIKGGMRQRLVAVGAHAWIASNVVLYNCIVGEGAIVAVGSVVRSCEVAPWTMVAGNPACVIARCPGRAPGMPWEYVEERWTVLE